MSIVWSPIEATEREQLESIASLISSGEMTWDRAEAHILFFVYPSCFEVSGPHAGQSGRFVSSPYEPPRFKRLMRCDA